MTEKEYKEFRVKDAFTTIQRGSRLTVADRIPGDIPLVTAGYEKTGVAGSIGNENQKIFPINTITIDMFGNCFYRSYRYSADDNIIILENPTLSKESLIYITASLNKYLQGKYSYGKQFRLGELEKINITLPVTSSGEPDYEYMADYIKQIQADYIKQIQAYLEVTGLTDTTLTEQERGST